MRKKDDEKEKSIKQAVVKLILESGFHGTSISKIAKEAGVSPATVYIYYDSKETMLQDMYNEYSEEIYDYLLDSLNNTMNGHELIETLAKRYYTYIKTNEEIFCFVDQFSSCPALASHCSQIRGLQQLNQLLEEMKHRKIFKDLRNENLMSILFYPVKSIAVKQCIGENEKVILLNEMIKIIETAVLF